MMFLFAYSQNYLTNDIVEGYFSDYKDDMIWILIIFSVVFSTLSIVIQYIQNLKLSKTVESYKNELSKSQIKFSRFNQLQIESLKNLYDHIVTYHFKYNILINPVFYTHKQLFDNLIALKNEHNICMEYFHRNKIFLTESLLLKVKDINNNFKLIKGHLEEEISSLCQVEEYHGSKDPQDIYETADNEMDVIKKRVSELKLKSGVVSFETDIKGMRTLIEGYFKELVN